MVYYNSNFWCLFLIASPAPAVGCGGVVSFLSGAQWFSEKTVVACLCHRLQCSASWNAANCHTADMPTQQIHTAMGHAPRSGTQDTVAILDSPPFLPGVSLLQGWDTHLQNILPGDT